MAKILVVDDDRSIVEMLQLLLTHEGHTVFVARDGKAGLILARDMRPDLILLDVMMPEMDGFSVSGELFKDAHLRQTPVIILTAKGHSRDIFTLVPNVKLHMDKPFDPLTLLKQIRQILPPAKAA